MRKNISLPGKVSKENDGIKVSFERLLHHPIEKVWDAITNPEQMKHWFTDVDMELRPGATITIKFRDEAQSLTYGEVVRVEYPNLFVWTWEGELAEWQLSKIDDQTTLLKFDYSKMTDEYAVQAPAGFHQLLDRLSERLDGSDDLYAFGAEGETEGKLVTTTLYHSEVFRSLPELSDMKPIVKEKFLNVPPDRVWKAITDKEEMKAWYFNLDDFQPIAGFRFSFPGQGHKGEAYIHHCQVIQSIPNEILQYSWSYENHEGFSIVTFWLKAENGGTRLILSHHGLESFPANNPDFARDSFNGGWTMLITELLPKHLGLEE